MRRLRIVECWYFYSTGFWLNSGNILGVCSEGYSLKSRWIKYVLNKLSLGSFQSFQVTQPSTKLPPLSVYSARRCSWLCLLCACRTSTVEWHHYMLRENASVIVIICCVFTVQLSYMHWVGSISPRIGLAVSADVYPYIRNCSGIKKKDTKQICCTSVASIS